MRTSDLRRPMVRVLGMLAALTLASVLAGCGAGSGESASQSDTWDAMRWDAGTWQ